MLFLMTTISSLIPCRKYPLPRQPVDPMRTGKTYVVEDGIDRAKPRPLYPFCGNREHVVSRPGLHSHKSLTEAVTPTCRILKPLSSLRQDDDPKMHPRKIPEPQQNRPMYSLKASLILGAFS